MENEMFYFEPYNRSSPIAIARSASIAEGSRNLETSQATRGSISFLAL